MHFKFSAPGTRLLARGWHKLMLLLRYLLCHRTPPDATLVHVQRSGAAMIHPRWVRKDGTGSVTGSSDQNVCPASFGEGILYTAEGW